ncbi:MAG: hypothetical protein JXR52_02635 [Bacteroidales bacterium]|nr:hypothetical protein [Bacteroidales bacterium]
MRKLKYLFMFIASMVLLTSCFDEYTDLDLNDDGPNLVTFERISTSLGEVADGSEYIFTVPIKVVGPTVTELTSDLTVTLVPTDESTAVEGVNYRFNNNPLTLTKANNYLGVVSITLVTKDIEIPMEGSPEFDDWEPPVLIVEIEVTGDPNVLGSGKGGVFTLNYRAPNPYAGLYDVEMRYFHPTAGGSHPSSPSFDPDDPYGGIRNSQKELIPITGRKCETGFAVWPDTDLCWITVNPDNSIKFEVADTWPYEVKLGDPFHADLESHFDPATRQIFLYYHYEGSGGARIFYEIFTPTF